jgi:1,4-dihydroxy-2-naphthoyl-CoA hydrolase
MERDELIGLIRARDQYTVFAALGIRVTSWDPEACAVAIDVDRRHLQHAGFMHGGISVLLAESAASLAAVLTVDMDANDVFGTEINASHLRPVTSGTVTATARPLRRGRTVHVYDVAVTDERGELVCASRCSVAVRSTVGQRPAAR